MVEPNSFPLSSKDSVMLPLTVSKWQFTAQFMLLMYQASLNASLGTSVAAGYGHLKSFEYLEAAKDGEFVALTGATNADTLAAFIRQTNEEVQAMTDLTAINGTVGDADILAEVKKYWADFTEKDFARFAA
jgi:hypothetical protein